MSVYESFVQYQTHLLQTFRERAVTEEFRVVDARRSVIEIFGSITTEVGKVIETMSLES